MTINKVTTESGYQIGRVQVDLTAYTGQDLYSEGDIENELLDIVRSGRQQEVLAADTRWPILYHLGSERENLLSWLPLRSGARLLEIGMGCGALTGILCQKAAQVETVEISPRRAEVAAWRHADCKNLKIHVGNLNDIAFTEKFDYVTLIGVLEYAGRFTHTMNPFQDFLTACRALLKPDGVLILAIENRLGLKYWSGAVEDHTGSRFDGIMNYSGYNGVRTFARKELATLITASGFAETEWYYPHPDYKLTDDLYSDAYLPTAPQMQAPSFCFDQDRCLLFNEQAAWAGIIQAGLYPQFANSFLVLCRNTKSIIETPPLPAYVHFTPYRKAAYRIGTEITSQKGHMEVRKIALTKAARLHLQTIEENGRILSRIYGKDHVAHSWRESDDVLRVEFLAGVSMEQYILQQLQRQNRAGLLNILRYYYQNILRGGLDSGKCFTSLDPNASDRSADIDLNFDNVFLSGKNFVISDYEWLLPDIPKSYTLWRSLSYLHQTHAALFQQCGLSIEQLFRGGGIPLEKIQMYKNFDNQFYEKILDRSLLHYRKKQMRVDIG